MNSESFVELLDTIVDNRGRTAPTVTAGIPLIATNCIKEDHLYPVKQKVRFVDEATYDTWFRGHPEPGDILFVCKGSPGRTALVTDPVDFVIAQDMVAVRPDPSKVYPKFLFAALRSPGIRQQIDSMHVGTLIPHFKKGDFDKLRIPIPDRETQVAIGDFYIEFSEKIESNRRAISIIDELVRARFEADFNLAQTADGVSVADLISINKKQKLSRGTKATYVGMSSLPEFSPEIFDWETREYGSGQKFVNGDVLMARITPCLENGKTAIVDMLEDGEIGWGSTEYVVLSPKGLISTPWIYALTRHELVREWAIRRMVGTSGRQRFQADDFGDYQIREPGQKSLEEFNSFAEPLFGYMTHLRDEMKRLASLREVLLPELLSGRVRVPPEEVVA